MSNRPLFLICNDDGVHAPGIKALATAAEQLGEVVIVAPHEEKSGFSQALTLTSPLRIDPIDARTYGVTGTPADCVILAFNKILKRRPDFVLSGINRGSNIGQDTLYSGTVAAAMEGYMQGAPGIAFSLDKRRAFGLNDYDDAVKVVNLVLKKIVEFKFSPENLLLEGSHSQGSLEEKECHGAVSNPQKSLGRPLTQGSLNGVLNVNIPDLAYNDIKGFTGATLGRRIYDKQVVEQIDPRGRPYYWIGGGGEDIEEIPGTDCQYLRDGYVTLTVLGPDHVLHRGQESLHLLATELNNKKRL